MRKIIKNTLFVILFSVLIMFAAFFVYQHFYASNDKNLSGTWTASLDMTEQAAVTALGWLQDIEAVSVSMQDMEAHMQGLTVTLHLTMEQTDRSGGTFASYVQPESYAACRQAAYEAFASAFRELLSKRLRMAGYAGGTDEESVEALVTETFGMSTTAYLMSCVPSLLPPLEDLQSQYDGSGTYETSEGILTRQFDSGQLVRTKKENCIRKDSTLILTGAADSAHYGYFADHYPVIYTLQQPQAEQ
ncbi:MAG: hypothetical protein K2N95_00445 [Lachnospiraceae bacterium]|nr:hypothetical protein [Lachnospiraceae bacterium]